MHRILLGHCPFEGTNGPDVRAQQLASAPASIVHASVCVSPALAAIIMRCLQKKPGDRFQTGAELVIALDRAQMAPSQVTWGEPVRIPKIPKKALAAVAAVVVVGQ